MNGQFIQMLQRMILKDILSVIDEEAMGIDELTWFPDYKEMGVDALIAPVERGEMVFDEPTDVIEAEIDVIEAETGAH